MRHALRDGPEKRKAATSAASFHREETPGKGDDVKDAA
jgi:hypothetical protein